MEFNCLLIKVDCLSACIVLGVIGAVLVIKSQIHFVRQSFQVLAEILINNAEGGGGGGST